jgi:hypothetical protein
MPSGKTDTACGSFFQKTQGVRRAFRCRNEGGRLMIYLVDRVAALSSDPTPDMH